MIAKCPMLIETRSRGRNDGKPLSPILQPKQKLGIPDHELDALPVEENAYVSQCLSSLIVSLTGCIVKSKCDETKPECITCMNKGLRCGGYDRGLRWSSKHQRKLSGNIDRGSSSISSLGAFESCDSNVSSQPETKHAPDAITPETNDWFFEGGQFLPRPSSSRTSSVNLEGPMGTVVGFSSGDGHSSMELQPDALFQLLEPGRLGTDTINPYQPFPDDMVTSSEAISVLTGWLDIGVNSYTQPIVSSLRSPATIPAVVRDVPSLLIDNWFRQVCSVWSAYDSDMNFFKKLAGLLWAHSETVSSCLQSMSSALLTEQIPQMKPTALNCMKEAMKSVQVEIISIRGIQELQTLPISLLFSLFCVGTTICWLDARQLGVPFLREAKALLLRINQQATNLSPEDRTILDFFNKSLIYWDMLLAVVKDDEDLRLDGPRDGASKGEMFLVAEKEGYNTQIIPHPWTGVSTVYAQLFAETIRLCRSFRSNARSQKFTATRLRTALREIEKAQKLEEKLLHLEHPNVGQITDTGDQRTPRPHLLEVAEAYRTAALLQLYQTFPDLVATHVPENTDADNSQVPWTECIIPLAFNLIKSLEQVPPGSGSRMLQPVLYITASTGLKLTSLATTSPTRGQTNGKLVHNSFESGDMSDYIEQFLAVESKNDHLITLSQMSLDIGNARRFVMERLNLLESTLPPKPIIMAKSLVKAIWEAYDNASPEAPPSHWIDIMEDQDLRSIFG
jgi:hypothetical protein